MRSAVVATVAKQFRALWAVAVERGRRLFEWDTETLRAVSNGALIASVVFGVFGLGFSYFATIIGARASDEMQRAASIEIARANEAAAQANERAARIMQLVAWRDVTPDQSQQLASQLRGVSLRVGIMPISTDPEVQYFADRLAAAFRQAGAQVSQMRGGSVGGPGMPTTGLTVASARPADVVDALRAAQFDVRSMAELGFSVGGAEHIIIVGSRPRPATEQ